MESANKRIAKNTIYMYIRLFTTTVIGLYMYRLVLALLGVSDYGLFAVVGGVLAMFTFISGSLSSATSRFFNTEMGKKDGDVNASFNINLLLHTFFAAIIFFFAEVIGLWYIYNHLNVAVGKLDDAVFIYHVSIVTACLGIINNPYQSLFIAHERFKFMAILDIVNSFLRLCCIFMLTIVPQNTLKLPSPFSLLRIYALIMMFTTINTFIVFHYVAYKDWPDIIKRRFIKGWNRYKEVLSFGGWNLLATLGYMARSSGSDLVINTFFGTTMNGAFAISKDVNSYVSTFSAYFDNASAPQIIQNYASGDKARYTYLANKMGRFNLLLFELIFFPLYIELDFILHIWLGKVPEGALNLTQINLIIAGVALSCGGIINVINASGKIKWFKFELCTFFVMCVPIGYLLFKLGLPPYSILICFLIADLMQRCVQLVLLRYIIGFDSLGYVRKAYVRPCVIAIIMSAIIYAYSFIQLQSIFSKLSIIVLCGLLTLFLVYMIGLKKEERQSVLNTIKITFAKHYIRIKE